jgi:hypothetical protein
MHCDCGKHEDCEAEHVDGPGSLDDPRRESGEWALHHRTQTAKNAMAMPPRFAAWALLRAERRSSDIEVR